MSLGKKLLPLSIVLSAGLLTNVANAQKDQPFIAAAVEFNPTFHELDKNISSLSSDIEKALKKGAKLVVAPEMATTGYLYESREEIAPYVDTIPGKTTNELAKLAKKYHAYIVTGMAERDNETGIFYNSSVLVGPEGVVGKYRKIHQWESEEHWAAWGDLGFPIFDTELGKIAINICMDSGYFESSRIPALGGADIIAFPTNSSIQAIYYNQARAMQNGVYIVEANRNNTEKDFHMVGMSAVWNPSGNKVIEAPFVSKEDKSPESTQIVYGKIDPQEFVQREIKLEGRRPELYQPLMFHIAPWNYKVDNTEREITSVAIQYQPSIGDKSTNLTSVTKLVAQLKDVDLAVLPEYSLTGERKIMSKDVAKEWAEPLNGFTFKHMSQLAKDRVINLVYTQIEQDGNDYYVTSVVLGKSGELIGSYRKTHLNSQEQTWAKAGNSIKSINVPEVGNLGIMLGEEVLYPEIAGVLSGQRVDIIAIPSSWAGEYGGYVQVNQKAVANPYPENSMVLWDAVAFSAQAYTVVANFVGSENKYRGESALYTLDPLYGLDQAKVASSNEAQALTVQFKTKNHDWWLNQSNMVTSRRTPYYKPLILPPKI
ncbi:hypothetical protein J4H58_12575 [Vibrio alginolyticus]|uniref:nitrilase-related carbon-nitrogen hydrolase n=1 Tax=Vibrio alginolyticus TaxID=663 RepID=UPI001BD31498|nr:nitrilase-related carbon-nitrogen hydrolase [Vibrio alginolyticus]MBS9855598.1 hypothetical protein [Vibrio alginolyticus]